MVRNSSFWKRILWRIFDAGQPWIVVALIGVPEERKILM